jgi:hypothetical protein
VVVRDEGGTAEVGDAELSGLVDNVTVEVPTAGAGRMEAALIDGTGGVVPLANADLGADGHLPHFGADTNQ